MRADSLDGGLAFLRCRIIRCRMFGWNCEGCEVLDGLVKGANVWMDL